MSYTNMTGQFIYKQPLFRAKLDALTENDLYLRNNGWQGSTRWIFFQATVPTGWTLYASPNDRFLRVVDGTGGQIGGQTGGSTLVSAGLSIAHANGLQTENNHTHTGIQGHYHRLGGFVTGVAGRYSPADYPANVGNTVAGWTSGSIGSGLESWVNGLNPTPYDIVATSSNGTHAHTVNSNLTNVVPAYVDIIIGTKNTVTGFVDQSSYFAHNQKFIYGSSPNVIPILGNNDEVNYGQLTAAGTTSVFASSVPTQWTWSAGSPNDVALRVVSGTGGGSGGTQATSSAFSLAHNHTLVAAGSHSHTVGNHRHDVEGGLQYTGGATYGYIVIDGSNYLRPTNTDGTVQNVVKGRSTQTGGGVTSGTNADHNHSVGSALSNITFAYYDVIRASKATISGTFYTLGTTPELLYKKLISKQRLEKYAVNDETIKLHTMSSGAISFFYQSSAPLTWTLSLAHTDKVLRMITGPAGGGGSGGSFGISGTITLAHTHSIGSYVHSHSYGTHSHPFETTSQAAGTIVANRYIVKYDGSSDPAWGCAVQGANTGSTIHHHVQNPSESVAATTDDNSHNHTGSTTSSLTDVVFAYANVLACTKNA